MGTLIWVLFTLIQVPSDYTFYHAYPLPIEGTKGETICRIIGESLKSNIGEGLRVKDYSCIQMSKEDATWFKENR